MNPRRATITLELVCKVDGEPEYRFLPVSETAIVRDDVDIRRLFLMSQVEMRLAARLALVQARETLERDLMVTR